MHITSAAKFQAKPLQFPSF